METPVGVVHDRGASGRRADVPSLPRLADRTRLDRRDRRRRPEPSNIGCRRRPGHSSACHGRSPLGVRPPDASSCRGAAPMIPVRRLEEVCHGRQDVHRRAGRGLPPGVRAAGIHGRSGRGDRRAARPARVRGWRRGVLVGVPARPRQALGDCAPRLHHAAGRVAARPRRDRARAERAADAVRPGCRGRPGLRGGRAAGHRVGARPPDPVGRGRRRRRQRRDALRAAGRSRRPACTGRLAPRRPADRAP